MEWWILVAIFVGLLAFMFLGVPIAISLGFMAWLLILIFWGPKALYIFATTAYGKTNSFILTAVPLFLIMADFITHSGMSEDAYKMLRRWIGHIPGGLAVASELGCTLFASVNGGSTTTTAIMGKIAVPEMLNSGYDKRLATGSIAAGGALGVLIPPSVLMILYGVMTETSVGHLFMGGIIPGLILSAMFIGYILIYCMMKPSKGPPVTGVSWQERWQSLWRILPVLLLGMFMFIAIYTGICTPTEVAGVGAFVALLIGLCYRRYTWTSLRNALLGTARTTSFILWILVGAVAFGSILSYLQIPQSLCQWVQGLEVSPYVILIGINTMLILLGCMMDPAGIIMLTAPILAPLIDALGFNPLWFGVMFVVNMELAEITPPLGLNLYVMKGIAPSEVELNDILSGAIPFMVLDVIGLILIIAFPQLVTWLPSTMH